MNRHHNALGSEPRWVTQCLDGYMENENKHCKKKQRTNITRLFEKLKTKNGHWGTNTSNKIREELEFRNQVQMIFNEILETVDSQSSSKKRSRKSDSDSASAPISRKNSEASDAMPKSILRNGRNKFPGSEMGEGWRQTPPMFLRGQTRNLESSAMMRLHHPGHPGLR